MNARHAAAAASLVLALGSVGAILRAAGERGLARAGEGLLGFVEGAMMAPVLAAVAIAAVRLLRGPGPAPDRGRVGSPRMG